MKIRFLTNVKSNYYSVQTSDGFENVVKLNQLYFVLRLNKCHIIHNGSVIVQWSIKKLCSHNQSSSRLFETFSTSILDYSTPSQRNFQGFFGQTFRKQRKICPFYKLVFITYSIWW